LAGSRGCDRMDIAEAVAFFHHRWGIGARTDRRCRAALAPLSFRRELAKIGVSSVGAKFEPEVARLDGQHRKARSGVGACHAAFRPGQRDRNNNVAHQHFDGPRAKRLKAPALQAPARHSGGGITHPLTRQLWIMSPRLHSRSPWSRQTHPIVILLSHSCEKTTGCGMQNGSANRIIWNLVASTHGSLRILDLL